ncbi:MAG: MarR family winged helix-turn-helix transcriptional regulator [Nocardioidaceae bacterium]
MSTPTGVRARVAPARQRGNEDASRLYLALGRLNRALRREAVDAPLGHGALSALATLVQHGTMRLGELAEAEGVSAPSMTRIVTSLEGLGATRRTQDPKDGRAFLVQATPSGRRLVDTGRAVRMRALCERVDSLPEDQREALMAAVPALEALAAT